MTQLSDLRWVHGVVQARLLDGVSGRIYIDVNRGDVTGAGFQPRSDYTPKGGT